MMMQIDTRNLIQFGRAPRNEQEWLDFECALKQGRQVAGIQRLSCMTPAGSLPSKNRATDTGTGELLAGLDFFRFMNRVGYDTFQLDPLGVRELTDASPYIGTVFSLDPLRCIDLEPLTTETWGGLLSRKTYNRIVRANPGSNGKRVAYAYAFKAKQEALNEVATNYIQHQNDPAMAEIKKRFNRFVSDNQSWLEKDALYEALTHVYHSDRWQTWQGENAELDKHLFCPVSGRENEAQKRIASLENDERTAPIIYSYQFAQFIAAEQTKTLNNSLSKIGVQTMADRQVGFSDRDNWAYQNLFLKDWSMGCPPDYFSETGQAWGFPVPDPDKLFTGQGQLGESGKLIYQLFKKMLTENPGGMRIDHIVGLIDPWVYPAGEKTTANGHRLYSSPEFAPLEKYACVRPADLNEEIDGESVNAANEQRVKTEAMTPEVIERYSRLLNKILIPAVREVEQETDQPVSILAEDLGTLTTPVVAVMKAMNLSGIRVTQFVDPNDPQHFYRGRNVHQNAWIAVGTHDNDSLLNWCRDLIKTGGETLAKHIDNLAEDLKEERRWFRSPKVRPETLAKAKWRELFISPSQKIQIFFSDIFGLSRYNTPGAPNGESWTLRIPRNYQERYFQQIRKGGTPNLPELLAERIQRQGKDKDHSELMADLNRFSAMLKE